MACILYNDHLIVSFPVLARQPKVEKPIQITLTLDKMQSFKTKAEAERARLDAAKSMIDSFTLALAPLTRYVSPLHWLEKCCGGQFYG